MNIEKYHEDLILAAFARCYGLKDALHTPSVQKDAIKALSEQTCIRVDFLSINIDKILEL